MSETEAASLVEADATRKHLILTELFGVHPRAIVDALVVSANEHLYILGSQLEDHVRSLLHDREEADKEAEEGVHSILTLLEHAIDHTMDTFELYCLRSIFVVTPEQSRLMTMSHHRGLDLRPLEVRHAENPMQESEAPARATQHRLAQAEAAAQVRLQRVQAVAQAYQFILDGVQPFVQAAQHESPDVAVVQAAEEVSSNVYSVMEALDTLRSAEPLHVALTDPSAIPPDSSNAHDDEAKREWEKGRDAYLTWETQRILAAMKR
ncbi:MIS12/MIND type complex protein [Malassezia pachydermatis]